MHARDGEEGGGLGSKHCGVLGAYGRDTRNDNGERLLTFASNHDLALVNTFFSTRKYGISHTFNGMGNKKRIDFILTRQRDRKLVRNVVTHPQPAFLPISDHNAVVAHVKLLGRFARNRPVRNCKKLPLNRRRLMTDPHLREEVATAIGARLRAIPPSGNNVDEVETSFATATLQVAETLVPCQDRTVPGRGWRGDAQTEAELSRALATRRAAWQRLERDKRSSQLRREVRRTSAVVRRVRTTAKDRFLEGYVEELEEEVRQHNQWGFFQRLKFLRIEDTQNDRLAVHPKTRKVFYCATRS